MSDQMEQLLLFIRGDLNVMYLTTCPSVEELNEWDAYATYEEGLDEWIVTKNS